MNLYPEVVESPNEPTRMVLYGRPGIKFFQTLAPIAFKIRAMWAGGGRLFVVHGTRFSEVTEAGGVTTATQLLLEGGVPNPPDAAQIFSNGHQLMIISGGQVYYDNGAGPEPAHFQLSGNGHTLPTGMGGTLDDVLTRDSGTVFTEAMVGGPITIAGRKHTVASFTDEDHVIVDPPTPVGGGEADIWWMFTGANYPHGVNILSRDPLTSVDTFTSAMVGELITVNHRNYDVTAWIDNDHLVLGAAIAGAPSEAPSEAGIRWNLAGGDVVTGVTGGFLDGYGIVNRPWPGPPGPGREVVPIGAPRRANRSGELEDHGRQFNISALNDFSFWDPLDFALKEGHSDYIVSILCDHEELWLFGTETTEVWTNVGDPNFPFQRVPGAFIHEGSVTLSAPCSVGTTVCWLGGGPNGQTVAYQAQGFQPKRISTHAQEQAWNAPGFTVRDALSYAYLDAGHLFWVINFSAEQKTWVWDMTTGLWHERAGWNAGSVAFTRYQPWFHVFIPEWGDAGKHIVGDPTTGILYEMSPELHGRRRQRD